MVDMTNRKSLMTALFVGLALAGCGGSATGSARALTSAAQPAASATAMTSPSAAASTASASAPAARGPDDITVAYTAATTVQLPLMVAKDKGFYAQNGLNADVTFIGAGSEPQAAVLAGQLIAYS